MRSQAFGVFSIAAVSLVALGCGGRPAAPRSEPARAVAQTPSESTADYEVHEWGLLRAIPGDALEAGAIAPPSRIEVLTVDKPVLYFHASTPMQLAHVRVEAVGGTIREHWPLTTDDAAPTSIDWRDVAIEPGTATRCTPRFPVPSSRPCSALGTGEACESAELGALVLGGSQCVRTGDAHLPFLFYRSRTSTFTPPLRVRALPNGALELTNSSDAAIPGFVVRMGRNGGQVRTIAVAAPGAHASVIVGGDFEHAVVPSAAPQASDESGRQVDQPALPGSAEPGRIAVERTLAQIGLTPAESGAFSRAWDAALFGENVIALIDLPAAAGDRRGVVDSFTADDQRVDDTLLYFLPPEVCDGVAKLRFTPAPRRVVRALAIWQPVR